MRRLVLRRLSIDGAEGAAAQSKVKGPADVLHLYSAQNWNWIRFYRRTFSRKDKTGPISLQNLVDVENVTAEEQLRKILNSDDSHVCSAAARWSDFDQSVVLDGPCAQMHDILRTKSILG